MTGTGEIVRLITAKNTQIIVSGPGYATTRVPVDIEEYTKAHEGTTMDEDFEPVPNEVGTFLWFCCHGDPAVRRFLYSRSIIDSKTFAPAECEWAIECGEGEKRTVAFLGRLYNYVERTVVPGKDIEMQGRIRIAD
ncbi:MAG: hypothetical protein OXU25_00060 [Thaumarchaeota archaeon]|nr:hypothetical protein [Nitrososphaerota archaeon]